VNAVVPTCLYKAGILPLQKENIPSLSKVFLITSTGPLKVVQDTVDVCNCKSSLTLSIGAIIVLLIKPAKQPANASDVMFDRIVLGGGGDVDVGWRGELRGMEAGGVGWGWRCGMRERFKDGHEGMGEGLWKKVWEPRSGVEGLLTTNEQQMCQE
jgi:hypothetical protein